MIENSVFIEIASYWCSGFCQLLKTILMIHARWSVVVDIETVKVERVKDSRLPLVLASRREFRLLLLLSLSSCVINKNITNWVCCCDSISTWRWTFDIVIGAQDLRSTSCSGTGFSFVKAVQRVSNTRIVTWLIRKSDIRWRRNLDNHHWHIEDKEARKRETTQEGERDNTKSQSQHERVNTSRTQTATA